LEEKGGFSNWLNLGIHKEVYPQIKENHYSNIRIFWQKRRNLVWKGLFGRVIWNYYSGLPPATKCGEGVPLGKIFQKRKDFSQFKKV